MDSISARMDTASKINDLQHEHWESGLDDIRDSFAHREWFDVPSREQGL
jgi:hypothetical protein